LAAAITIARGCWSVRIVREETVLDVGGAGASREVARALDDIRAAVSQVTWPPGNDTFVIKPGKEANGVRPIRDAFVLALEGRGWKKEQPFPLTPAPDPLAVPGSRKGTSFGDMDARLDMDGMKPFMAEWETGNISSSHRAMNKMALGLVAGAVTGAVLVVPTWPLAYHLTDRIGNFAELWGYLPLWQSIRVAYGFFGVVAVEHDGTDPGVPAITKGTDGRALV